MVRKFILLFSILIAYFPSDLLAKDVITILNDSDVIRNVGMKVSYLIDEEDNLTIDEVQQQQFIPSQQDVLNFQISKKSYWIKFSILNNSDNPNVLLKIDHATIDQISLYTFKGDQHVQTTELGENKPFRQREFNYQEYLFNTYIKKGDTLNYYLHVKANEQLLVPISIGHVKSILESLTVKDLVFGIYIGAIFVMAIYNLFLYLSLRDRTYFYYVTYIVFVALSQTVLQGYAFRFLWPNQYWINNPAAVIVPVINGLAALAFIRVFLNLRHIAPRFDLGMSIMVVIYLIPVIPIFFGEYALGQILVQLVAFLAAVYVTYIAAHLTFNGNRLASRLLGAWIAFLLGVMVFVFRNFNLLPYNLFTYYSIQIGSLVEVALLSFALGDKINYYRREKEISQAQALRITEENARIIREQNTMLELEVNKQTLDLRKANHELNVSLDNLQQTQAQLVAAEKLASLGMLTAGIAHEINNPINFVTSNARPLKRDFNQLLNIIKSVENIATQNGELEDVRAAIDEIKDEEDFDYLIVEVAHLIQGIEEGAMRTAEIVKSLRVFSRVDEDDLKPANINECIESTLVVLNSIFGEYISVNKNFDSAIPIVECYPGKLNQVFLNIITNAVHAIKARFMDELGGELSILTNHDENFVYITIKDNGTGIGEDIKSKMFDPFFTTKDVGEGTGLGLSIVYQTIQKHRGNIKVNSAIGEGTEFVLAIPILQNQKKDESRQIN